MDQKESHELIQLIKHELKPNTLPREFVDSISHPQTWAFQMPITVVPSDYVQLIMTKTDADRIRFEFMRNSMMVARLDFYAG